LKQGAVAEVPNRSEISPVLRQRKRLLMRAETLFAGAVTLAAFVAAVSTATLPADLVVPIVASTLLLAAALALVAGRFVQSGHEDVSCRDVAGALSLIGAFAATTIEPEQLMRLVAGH